MNTTAQKPVAPVEFVGVQSGFGILKDFELWNTTEDFAGHKKGATLSAETIDKLGYITPARADVLKVQHQRQRMKNSFSAHPFST